MSNVVGVDVGTMNLVSAKSEKDKKIKISSMRNMFLEVKDALLSSTELNNIDFDHIKTTDEDEEDSKIYMIGEECFKMSRRFGLEVRRPMERGVISSKDIDALDILTKMIEKLIGKANSGVCVYSIPALAIDTQMPPISYHERVFSKIFTALGYKPISINEAMAIIFYECEKENFSGITLSFGCGLTNVACAYKGIPVMTFSVARGGDWVDNFVAQSLNMPVTKVTALKESEKFNLSSTQKCKNKKERRALQALTFAYQDLINYCISGIVDKFNEASENIDIDEEIPIIVSGGTSCPQGFLNFFKEVFNSRSDFPYDISEIRQTDNPLGSVACGALVYGQWSKFKEEKK